MKRVLSEEHKKKISNALKGIKRSKETREKISRIRTGQKQSVETIRNRVLKNTGKKRTFEQKQKIRDALKGVPKTIMHRLKMSQNHADISGKNNPNWRGGISSLNSTIRRSEKYKKWRSEVFERDNYTCIICKQIGRKLNCDHIKPFSIIVKESNIKTLQNAINCKELWNINNGRTLCIKCHTETNTYKTKSKYYYDYIQNINIYNLL